MGGYGTTLAEVGFDGTAVYVPYAEVYRQMADSLVGTHQIVTAEMDHARDEDYAIYAYEDDAKAVVFLAANDFTGSVSVDLENFGGVGYAWIERISETGNVVDGFTTVVTQEVVANTNDGFTISFNTAYELVRVIVAR